MEKGTRTGTKTGNGNKKTGTVTHLDCYDRENFYSDPVELVKAAPGPGLGEAFEDVAAGLVVHLLGAVKDVDHDADGPE